MKITEEQYQALMICAKLGHSTTPEVLVSILEDRKALLAVAPTPPQPIYDEAKERELFEEFSRRIIAHDAANFPIRWCDCVTDEAIEDHLNTWLACAQSRAKAVEVGHE